MTTRRFRRQRWRGARRGLVAAVTTLFGLLIVVILMTTYLIAPLQVQEQNAENQHLLQVEDQLGLFQGAISRDATSGLAGVVYTVPVTLGSNAVPPFGVGSSSTLELASSTASTQNSFSVNQAVPDSIIWNITFGNGTKCIHTKSCHYVYYNVAFNDTGFTGAANGSSGQTVYAAGTAGYGEVVNFLGHDNQNLTFDVAGNANYAYIVVAGSNDSLGLAAQGKGNCNNETILVYGQHDSVDLTNTVCGYVSVVYLTSTNSANPSSQAAQCPANNVQLQQTDTVTFPAPSTTISVHVNLTRWYYTGPPYTTNFTNATAPNGFVYQNRTIDVQGGSYPGCAFTTIHTTKYSLSSSASLLVHLENRYSGAADVAFEEGAVIAQQAGGVPIMIDPPLVSVSPFTPVGYSGAVTMISFVGNPAAVSGTGVVGLSTRVVAVNRLSMGMGPSPFFFGGFTFDITTAFPQAWWNYFLENPTTYPSTSISCHLTGTSIAVSCDQPVSGGNLVSIQATLNVQVIQITDIVVDVSFS